MQVLNLNKKKREGGIGGRAQRTHFHMQGAGLNVILKVYVGRYVCMYACMYVYAGFGLGFRDTTCRYNYVII